MPFRCASTATHGLQYSLDRFAVDDGNHAGHGARVCEVELDDAGMRVRAAEKHDVRKPRQAQVVGINAAPLQQPLRVRARHALADVAAVDLRARRVQRQPPCAVQHYVSIASTIAW